MSACSFLEWSCWTISIALIVILLAVGCMEMCKVRRTDGDSERATGKSGKRASFHSSNASKSSKIDATSGGASASPMPEDDDASYGLPISMGAKPSPPSVLNDLYMNTQTDEVNAPKIDREQYKRASNVRTGVGSESQRTGGALARNVGMSGLGEMLRCSKPKVPIGVKCVSFMDSDSRIMAHHAQSGCLDPDKGNCPVESGSDSRWDE